MSVGPLHLLRPQRSILHRALPPLLLLALSEPYTLRRRRKPLLAHTWNTRCAQAKLVLPLAVLCRCYGGGARKQDGLHRALGLLVGFFPRHARQADHQRGADEEGGFVAC